MPLTRSESFRDLSMSTHTALRSRKRTANYQLPLARTSTFLRTSPQDYPGMSPERPSSSASEDPSPMLLSRKMLLSTTGYKLASSPTGKRQDSDDQGLSSSPPHGGLKGELSYSEFKARFNSSSTLKIKRMRTCATELPMPRKGQGRFRCTGCKEDKLFKGMFMYLDDIFCSEACRNEAIALDEMGMLRL